MASKLENYKVKRRVRLLLLLIFLPCIGWSQHNSLQWWPLVNISKTKGDFKFFYEEQLRFKQMVSDLYVIYSDIGIYYKINDHLNLGPVYRPWWNKSGDNYSMVNRMLFDVTLKNNYNNIEYSYRSRYQAIMRFSDKDPKEHFSRNKFEIRYNGWKLKPFISSELFFPLFKTTPNFLDKIRNTLGLEIPISKHSAFIPLLMYIKDKSASDFKDQYIVGGGYYFMF